MQNDRTQKRVHRHRRIRARISGSDVCPRISVFRSNKHLSVQVIDDVAGRTLVSVRDADITKAKKGSEGAFELGELLAKRALEKKISVAVFDRGGYLYTGKVKALAEGARKGGLQF